MLTKLSNSWNLVKSSARVLQADKELMIFPILSSIGVLLVSATFFLPIFLAGAFDSTFFGDLDVLGLVVLFLFYIAQYFVIFFANTALVGAAMIRLRGGDPTVGDGFRIAFSRFGPILGYALIAATVGMILRTISNRSKGLGKTVISLIGFAWNVATFLVVPILAVENVGPIEAIKRSVQYLKRTWGEQIAGNFGLGAFFTLIYVGLFIVFIPLFILAISNQSITLAIVLGVIFLLVLVLTGLINSTLTGIYTAAVYQYAVQGVSGQFFDPTLVKNAFKSN